jgi:anti-sigma regulatory factor (Ser/Thr protein kinase)
MQLYCYDGYFSSQDLSTQSFKFKELIHHLNCNDQQAYDLFLGFIELFQNVILHATVIPNEKRKLKSSSITLSVINEKTYRLQSQNLITSNDVHHIREQFSSLSTLKAAKEKATLGLYLLNKCSKHTLTSTIDNNDLEGFKTLTITSYI